VHLTVTLMVIALTNNHITVTTPVNANNNNDRHISVNHHTAIASIVKSSHKPAVVYDQLQETAVKFCILHYKLQWSREQWGNQMQPVKLLRYMSNTHQKMTSQIAAYHLTDRLTVYQCCLSQECPLSLHVVSTAQAVHLSTIITQHNSHTLQ